MSDINNMEHWSLDEWEQWMEVVEQEKETITYQLLNGARTFVRNKGRYQEALLHPCSTNEYVWQFTYVDEHGPVGHACRNTLEEMATVVKDYGFEVTEPANLKWLGD